jgi:trans-aconitate 2-methyltransferase
VMRTDIWSPRQYGAFGGHRNRPFRELLGRVGARDPRAVFDLGCGPGELTADLAARWPQARVTGVDNSEAMISSARLHESDNLTFELGDIGTWTPDATPDVIVSNAALQWVPGHRELIPRWVEALAPGGWFAFQVPGNFDAPSHALLRELCSSPRWKARLAAALRHDVVASPGEYLDLLAGLGCQVDVWETTYQQVLTGQQAVLEWTKGTALRPVLAALPDDAAEAEFLREYRDLLDAAYPPRPYGTVFAFRRIFAVARRPA